MTEANNLTFRPPKQWQLTENENITSYANWQSNIMYISRVYAHDLQTKSLKEIQPQLTEAMDSLLHDLAVQDDISINFSSTRKPQRSGANNPPRFSNNHPPRFSNNNNKNIPSKLCIFCKAAGKNHNGHDISTCWYLSKFDKLNIDND